MAEQKQEYTPKTKAALVQYLQERLGAANQKGDLWTELYDNDDLTMVTENHAAVIPTKLRMRLINHAIDPKRTKPLSELWISDFNAEMVSFKRQGRLEGLGALQALEAAPDERTARL